MLTLTPQNDLGCSEPYHIQHPRHTNNTIRVFVLSLPLPPNLRCDSDAIHSSLPSCLPPFFSHSYCLNFLSSIIHPPISSSLPSDSREHQTRLIIYCNLLQSISYHSSGLCIWIIDQFGSTFSTILQELFDYSWLGAQQGNTEMNPGKENKLPVIRIDEDEWLRDKKFEPFHSSGMPFGMSLDSNQED